MTPKRKPPAHLRAAETRARKPAPLSRAVRELLRDVVLLDGDSTTPFDNGDDGYPVPSLDAMANRAARMLGTSKERIVAKARKAGRK